MERFPRKILMYILIMAIECINCSASEDVKRFIIVSDYERAWPFYHTYFTPKESCEWNIDIDTKKQICKDITDSYLFHENEEQLYEETKKFANLRNRIFKNSRAVNNYGTKLITVDRGIGEEPVEENVFVCLTRKDNQIIENYISQEYNMNLESKGSDYEYLTGRFIFRKDLSTKKIRLHGMAEIPAEVFVSPDYPVEHLYLQRRKLFRVAWRIADDALCKLSPIRKARVCMAVFNSKYFDEGREIYPSNIDQVEYECELKTVSFQTKLGKKEAHNRSYRERMLSCWYAGSHEVFHFYLSQAYQSNEIFVYFKNPYNFKVTLENLSTHVRLPVRKNRLYSQGEDENVLEDLREKLLETVRPDMCKTSRK